MAWLLRGRKRLRTPWLRHATATAFATVPHTATAISCRNLRSSRYLVTRSSLPKTRSQSAPLRDSMAGRVLQRLREMAGVAVLLTWETPEWVEWIFLWVALAASQAAFVVGRFARDLERVQAIHALAKMSQVRYVAVIQSSTYLLGSAAMYGMLAGAWLNLYRRTAAAELTKSMWISLCISGIFVSIACCLFTLVVMSWALVALEQVLSSPHISVSQYGCL